MAQQTDEKGKPLTYWGGLKDRTCHHSNCREVCPECKIRHIKKVMRIDDINAMAEEDIIKNEINKLTEEVYLEHENNDILYGDSLELRLTYKAGVVDGYNKAKETLYTEEQMLECWNTSIADVTSFKTFIELLKHPKQ